MKTKTFAESGYLFDFSNAMCAKKADETNYAGLSSVDFIVETATAFYFVEVKNPDNPRTPAENQEDYLRRLNEAVFPLEAVKKFSDTLLSQLAMGRVFPKPVHYIYLLEFQAFTSYERLALWEKVSKRLPVGLKNKRFVNVLNVGKFELLTMEQFQNTYREFPVEAES